MSASGPRLLHTFGLVVCAVALAGACSGGSGTSTAERRERIDSACGLVARLADAAEPLAAVDVADPDAFRRDFGAAILEFGNTLDSLADVVPASLRSDVLAVEKHVQRYEFDEARAARVPIDDWARRACSGS
jgi:hypothetical protein